MRNKYFLLLVFSNRRDGVVVRASASQSVDLGFIPLVESYQKTLKNIYSFPAWRSAFMGGCGELLVFSNLPVHAHVSLNTFFDLPVTHSGRPVLNLLPLRSKCVS